MTTPIETPKWFAFIKVGERNVIRRQDEKFVFPATATATCLQLLPSEATPERAALELARAAKIKSIGEKLREDLLAVFASWTPGEQYDFDGARRAIADDLERGDIAKVISGITNFRAGDTSLDVHREALIAILNPAAARFAAVAAATTVEAIAAIV